VNLGDAFILGVVEGLTEWIPVSSTAHLTIVEQLLGLDVDDKSVTAFTAVIQFGAIVAAILFFRRDIVRLISAVLHGVRRPEARRNPDWRLAWYVVAGSIPIAIVGLAARNLVEGPLRSLWVIGAALILWSPVMVAAERHARQTRGENELNLRDAVVIGTVQCAALVPGVSRSGATISAGLFRGLNRVTATRLSFFLSIPALTAAAVLELPSALGEDVGAGALLVGTLTSFVVGYITIAWLIRFVAHHPISAFVPYRVVLGAAVLIGMTVSTLA